MINYWSVSRPKRRLDSVPEVLTAYADISLNQQWNGQRDTQMRFEEALEKAGLKRVGSRRDQSGSGGRTYGAWLKSLGLIFYQATTHQVRLTLAGEAIMAGEPPVEILTNQVLKYQFPSAYSIGVGVKVSPRFHIHPFRFLLRLLMDDRIGYLTQEEVGRICATEAERENDSCYEHVVEKILAYREKGTDSLDPDFFEKYKPGKGEVSPDHPYSHLDDIGNTMINWIEYTQFARRSNDSHLIILDDKRDEVQKILSSPAPFIDRQTDEEYFQRKYGLDPKHQKDTRNLEKTQTITAKMIAEQKIRQAYVRISLKKPLTGITADLIDEIQDETGIRPELVNEVLQKNYPHGSIGAFMASYFEMAFQGRDETVDFEKATTEIFRNVFHYNATHLGQTGNKSAPDILLISDSDGYQAVIDNKAYSRYSITGDHHNRMVHNYLERINSYSPCPYPVGFFSYIAGGFIGTIDRQIESEVHESGVHGSGITVANFIKMIENAERKPYTHHELRKIFSLDRQITLRDIAR